MTEATVIQFPGHPYTCPGCGDVMPGPCADHYYFCDDCLTAASERF